MELDPRWEIEIWEGIYESQVQQIICQFVKPGITFYDVGAGIGFYTLGAARFGATVVAFEPDPNNGAALQRHIQLNHLDFRLRRQGSF